MLLSCTAASDGRNMLSFPRTLEHYWNKWILGERIGWWDPAKFCRFYWEKENGAEGQNRTADTMIFSEVLTMATSGLNPYLLGLLSRTLATSGLLRTGVSTLFAQEFAQNLRVQLP